MLLRALFCGNGLGCHADSIMVARYTSLYKFDDQIAAHNFLQFDR